MGRKVTVFATFWGLNVLKKTRKPARLQKTLLQKILGLMLPRGAQKVNLSRMHMLGMGTQMIKGIMKKHQIDELEVMIAKAMENGVRIVACQMSMELMGIKQEELLDGVESGGVASFLEAGEQSDTSLFIS
jgi:peroxiredoxin family protein